VKTERQHSTISSLLSAGITRSRAATAVTAGLLLLPQDICRKEFPKSTAASMFFFPFFYGLAPPPRDLEHAFIRNANRDGHKLEKRRASYRSCVSAYGDAAVVCKPVAFHPPQPAQLRPQPIQLKCVCVIMYRRNCKQGIFLWLMHPTVRMPSWCALILYCLSC
jgi:hypothetical protein